MFYSGIADEAARDAKQQVEAHRDLGWSHIELRNISGINAVDLPDDQFDALRRLLREAGLEVSCFASQIANWSRPISSDFERDVSELRRAIPRMRLLSTPFIRCMSYPNADPPWPDDRWRAEAIRRMRALAEIAEKGGVILVHENCSGWGGLSPERTLELLAEVRSNHLKLVFDTGNPAQYRQDAWSITGRSRITSPTCTSRTTFPAEGTTRSRRAIPARGSAGYATSSPTFSRAATREASPSSPTSPR